MRIGILTISDTCYAQPNADRSGPELQRLLEAEREALGAIEYKCGIVPDEAPLITRWLVEHLDYLDIILTTGGTGLSPRKQIF